MAIVEAQIEDYRSVLRRVDILVKRDDPESLKKFFKAATEKEQIESFFNSDWCEELRVGSGYSGPYILEQLKKQYPIDEKLYQKRLSKALIENYRSVLRRVDILVKRDDPESLKKFFKAATEKEQIERFFNSDWCEELRVLKKQYPIDEKLYQKRLREAKKEAYLEQLRKEGRKRASKNK